MTMLWYIVKYTLSLSTHNYREFGKRMAEAYTYEQYLYWCNRPEYTELYLLCEDYTPGV